jgi:2-oxoglutarate dehydrogenase E2 component (dihydrolipoamide succinyltransferase)
VGAVVGQIDESASKPAPSNGAAAKSEGTSTTGTAAPAKAEAKAEVKAETAKGGSADAALNTAKVDSAGLSGLVPAQTPASSAPSPSHGEHKATPLARKLAEDKGVNLGSISGTGASGRIREQDVLAFIQTHQNGSVAAPATPAAGTGHASGSRAVRREKMTPLRQRIASRLVEAQQTAAMLTTFNEVDMGAVMDLRKQHKDAFEKKHGIGLGFMSFFVTAARQALEKFPLINATIVAGDDGKPAIEHHDFQDIAIAVAGPKGLVVPVIRNTEDLSFAGIESAIKDFGSRVKEGKLELSEMTGGTFTITNGGVFGSLMSTPILNPPQSAILGMHTIKNRPVEYPEKSGQIALRPMMYLALSYDHRIVDGAEAVQFLVSIKNAIEDPARLMLDL